MQPERGGSAARTSGLGGALVGVMGVWLVCRPLPDLVTSVAGFLVLPGAGAPAFVGVHAVQAVASALIGCALVLSRRHLGRWLGDAADPHDVAARTLLGIGVAIVGVYLLADGVRALAVNVLVAGREGGASAHLLASGLVSAVLGLLLLAGSIGLSRLWLWLRGRVEGAP